MSYEHKDWVDGEELTPDALDNIEVGVMSVNSGYVPYDWENGDVVTAERLNHIEDGIVAVWPQPNGALTVVNNTSVGIDVTYQKLTSYGISEVQERLNSGDSQTFNVYRTLYQEIFDLGGSSFGYSTSGISIAASTHPRYHGTWLFVRVPSGTGTITLTDL